MGHGHKDIWNGSFTWSRKPDLDNLFDPLVSKNWTPFLFAFRIILLVL